MIAGSQKTRLTYAEQLKHPLWQRRRLETLQRCNWQCQACRATDRTLHVHHKRYVKGRLAWEYSDVDLTTLCDECHDSAHAQRELLMHVLCFADGAPPMRLTEADLAILVQGLLMQAAADHPQWMELVDLAPLQASRIASVGALAAAAHASALTHDEVCQLTEALASDGVPAIRELLQTRAAELQALVAKDLA